jgi:hypothetical protein
MSIAEFFGFKRKARSSEERGTRRSVRMNELEDEWIAALVAADYSHLKSSEAACSGTSISGR